MAHFTNKHSYMEKPLSDNNNSNDNKKYKNTVSTSQYKQKIYAYLRQCGDLRHYEMKTDRRGHVNKDFMIGKGTYGQVYFVKDKRHNTDSKYKYCALKKITLHNKASDGFPRSSIREISLLRKMDHPAIVKLLDVVIGNKRDDVYLAFEYCATDLGRILKQHGNGFFKVPHIKRIMLSLCQGLEYLHQNYIMHRDLKVANILYTNDGAIKIADFGMARVFSQPHEKYTPKVVTMWYRCPEILLGTKEYDEKCDMWSLGCMFGELIKGENILRGEKELDQMIKIVNFIGKPSKDDLNEIRNYPNTKMLENQLKKQSFGGISNTNNKNGNVDIAKVLNGIDSFCKQFHLSEETVNLLKAMLSFSSNKRISAKACLKHAYFLSEGPKPSNMMPKNHNNLQQKFDGIE